MDALLEATARAEATHCWFRGFRWFVSPLLARAAVGRQGLRLLDCGCGTGNNLSLLAPYGTAVGFDLNAVGLRVGRRAGRRRLARASVDAVPYPDQCFDVVTSFDVLYALPDPVERAAVREMYRVLVPGGRLVVNVAAMASLRGAHSVLSHEVRRYSRADLIARLEDAGFVVEWSSYTNAVLYPPMALGRALQRWRGLADDAANTDDIRVPPAPVNALLSALLWLEAIWLRCGGRSPMGSSLLCLARKPA